MALQIRIGSTYKEYKIMKRLGSGSFGQVFKSKHENGGGEKALKFIVKTDESGKKEVEVLKLLEDVRGIPKLEDSFVMDCWLILVMPMYLGDLENLKDGYYEPKTTMKIGIEVVKILQDIHSIGVVHRDLKLSNLMIPYGTRGAKLVIIDLGMAVIFKGKNNNNRRSRLPIVQLEYNFLSCPYSSRMWL